MSGQNQKSRAFSVANGLFVVMTHRPRLLVLSIVPNTEGYTPTVNLLVRAEDLQFLGEQFIAAAKLEGE